MRPAHVIAGLAIVGLPLAGGNFLLRPAGDGGIPLTPTRLRIRVIEAQVRRAREVPAADSAEAQNDENRGGESLVLFLRRSAAGLPAEADGRWYSDTDGDGLPEFCDSWRNPIAYFDSSSYAGSAPVSKYRMADGRLASVSPIREPDHGLPVMQGFWQLLSAGPDGRFGTDDDVTNGGK